jgi:hypothetical protein
VRSPSPHARLASTGVRGDAHRIGRLPPPEPGTAHLLNDGDNDHIGDPDRDNKRDTDHDAYYDYKPNDNHRYRDSDDALFIPRGAPPGAADRRAIIALIKRYYALARSGQGREACHLLAPSLRNADMVQFGRYGPRYLRGAFRCPAVLGRIFAHRHREMTAGVTVTSVRIVSPGHAFVLIGSRAMPASYITPIRLGGKWVLDELLGNPTM